MNSHSPNRPIPLHLDLRNRRPLHRPNVPPPGRRIPPDQQPTRHAYRHHRHNPRRRKLPHRALEQHLRPPEHQHRLLSFDPVELRVAGDGDES